MRSAAPQTKAAELFERLQALKASTVSDMELQRLKRDAEKLLQSDALYAYMALGAIAVLRLDDAGVHANFRAALGLEKGEVVYHNYATALARIGDFDSALPWFEKTHQFLPEDLTSLADFIQCAFNAGELSMAKELLAEWKKRQPEKAFRLSDAITDAHTFLAASKISEITLKKIHHTVFELLRANNIPYDSLAINVIEDGSAAMYDLDVEVPAPAVNVSQLNITLANILACQEYDTFPEALSVGFSAVK